MPLRADCVPRECSAFVQVKWHRLIGVPALRHWQLYAQRCELSEFRVGRYSIKNGNVRTFSLLGEKREGVVFSRPLRALRAA